MVGWREFIQQLSDYLLLNCCVEQMSFVSVVVVVAEVVVVVVVICTYTEEKVYFPFVLYSVGFS